VVDGTILIKWKRKVFHSLAATLTILPFPEFIYAFDEAGRRIPKAEFGKRFTSHWYNNRALGTGPYRFTNYSPGVSITLDRNDDYWGPKPPIRRLHYLIYRDETLNILKLKSMEQDFASLTAAQYRDEVLQGRPSRRSPATAQRRRLPGRLLLYIG
jgi:ABC-type transport system substrate-binding protein